MQPEFARTGSESRPGATGPGLAALLAQLSRASASTSTSTFVRPVSARAFVEGLGRWLGWKEAIALSAVLADRPNPPASEPQPAQTAPGLHAALAALDAEFTRVQAALQAELMQALGDAERDAEQGAEGGAPGSFHPWRRCFQQLQPRFDKAAGALRSQARTALHRLGSVPGQSVQRAELAELAALDAVLASALAGHEQAQLARLPDRMEARFPAQAGTPQALRATLQALLQAELELRLQPALGLLEALRAACGGEPR